MHGHVCCFCLLLIPLHPFATTSVSTHTPGCTSCVNKRTSRVTSQHAGIHEDMLKHTYVINCVTQPLPPPDLVAFLCWLQFHY
jgi:hypothetical protein